jgi:transcriptional regulator with XRE-family HTH domain
MNQLRIGKFIAKLRHDKNLTQEQLGTKIGVSSKTISRWENGNYMPDISLLEPISKELGVTISELLKGQRIEKENLLDESNKDILNLLKSKKKERKKYIKFFIIGGIMLLIGIVIAIVQTIRLNDAIEEKGVITLINDVYISEKGAEINHQELLILQQIYQYKKEQIEQITEEEVDLLVNSYYAQLDVVHMTKYSYGLIGAGITANVFDAEVKVALVNQKYFPFTSIIAFDNLEEYYCVLGQSKHGAFILAEYKDDKCIITEKECEFLKEEGVTTKLNLDYCN